MVPVLLLLLVGPALADTVYFRSGEAMKGLVVEEHHDRIVFSTEEVERILLSEEIDEVFYDEPERNYLYLGRRAMEEGEFDLARGLLQKGLQINPMLIEAEDALSRLEQEQAWGSVIARPADPLAAVWEQLGLRLGDGEAGPVTAEVRPGSAAEGAGVQPGDALVRAWDLSLGFLPAAAAAGELAGPPRTAVKLAIQRAFTLVRDPAAPRGWPGMGLEMRWLGLTVERVDPDGAAEAAGLRPLDRIVAIGPKATRYLPLGQARRLIEEAKGKLVLLIQRDLLLTRES